MSHTVRNTVYLWQKNPDLSISSLAVSGVVHLKRIPPDARFVHVHFGWQETAGQARDFSVLSSITLWVCFLLCRCTCVCRTACLWPKVTVWSSLSNITQQPRVWMRTSGVKYRYKRYKHLCSCMYTRPFVLQAWIMHKQPPWTP